MAKLVELTVVEGEFEEIRESYNNLKLHLYAHLKEFVKESGGIEAFTDEARQWIIDKYDELLDQ